eukprot:TRINITY_DN34983_c0_g1_i1.p1 TRINITY_DN34983_c0_g1~~TRINITY_DN34983_c0_g1_i1.p1  ORF type:complete len:321 (-),score=80.70 TRINITY_DN34983_c0_g1_i1:152-1114(-)
MAAHGEAAGPTGVTGAWQVPDVLDVDLSEGRGDLAEMAADTSDPLNLLLGMDEQRALQALRELAAERYGPTAMAEDNPIENKAFSDCRYVSCKNLGLSLRLTPAASSSGRVDTAFLYSEGVDGFRAYSSAALPEGLAWSDVSRDVVMRLGEPSDKWGGGRTPVSISYETRGLDINFKNKSWDDAQNPLAFIAVFERKSQGADLCAFCGKQAKFNCSRCRGRRFCSSACQKADWPRHRADCDAAHALMAAKIGEAQKTSLRETVEAALRQKEPTKPSSAGVQAGGPAQGPVLALGSKAVPSPCRSQAPQPQPPETQLDGMD